uniref:HTH CENPB-type domain-containing protein n=1 Tax=Xenopus tropicalis TaxID=8364 RepID=F6WUM2_XENTR
MWLTGKKRKSLSLEEKIAILDRADSYHGTRVALAKELGIPVSTLGTIIKQRASTEGSADKCGPQAKKRKYVTQSKYEQMEKLLQEWFAGLHASNVPISGIMLREKAVHIATRLGIDNFTASNGWIDRFKKRYNVVYKAVCGESKSVDIDTVTNWKTNQLPCYLEGYELKNIFNTDETGLFFNVLPGKTFCFRGEDCHGGKLSKLRLTVLFTTNADGSEKLKPLVIGKSVKPRCFKNVNTLPTNYTANTKAWMTTKLFEEQMHLLDNRMRLQKHKILLFLDRCPAHPPSLHLHNVKLVFFSKKSCKQAWNQIKQSTIVNCFQKAGFCDETEEMGEDNLEEGNDDLNDAWEQLQTGTTFSNFVAIDNDIPSFDVRNTDEILDDHINETDQDDEDETSEPVEDEEIHIPTSSKALSAIVTLRNYHSTAESNESLFDNLYKVQKTN